jgi:putative FmdB family regulatory protein
MPIYAYRCAACGHAKDVLQRVSDPLLSVCPACGAQAFSKQVTAAGFQLKGSGWYASDFKGNGKPAAPDAANKADKADKPEKTEKTEKTEKADKSASTASQPAAEAGKPSAPSASDGGKSGGSGGASCACH